MITTLSDQDSNEKPVREGAQHKTKPKTATRGSSFWVYVFRAIPTELY
jgi:hypothetical protein